MPCWGRGILPHMVISLVAILPKHKVSSSKAAREGLNRVLLEFRRNSMQGLQKYPKWQPWKNPPKSGPRAGGKRTGNLGRNWKTVEHIKGESITISNGVPYAKYVQGTNKTQARALAARGWPRVDEIGKKAARKAIDDVAKAGEIYKPMF